MAAMDEHGLLIHSPLQQIYRDRDRWVETCIYWMPNTGWALGLELKKLFEI